MELRSEEKQEKENKGRKIIVITIAILIAIIITIGVAIVILKQAENEKMKLSVDGKSVALSSNMIIQDETTGEEYYSIEQVAKLTGYAFYNGEYKKYSEDKTKCYVECENEVAMFEMGSKTLYKSNSKEKVNFEAYKLTKAVKSYNGALYINADTLQIAFNTTVSRDKSNNTVILNTLPYLVDYYKSSAEKNGYKGICEDFETQKAIIKNLLVVNKDGYYGVVSLDTGNSVIGNKYSKIKYIESTGEFFVGNEGKVGTISATGETKIGLRYDEIGLIDSENEIYYAANNHLYGILNNKGKVLAYLQYDVIGVDRTEFPLADMKNDKFLYNNCIPVRKDAKWGLIDKNGNMILNVEYDELGYIDLTINEVPEENGNNTTNNVVDTHTTTERSINNVIVIPEIEGIVVGKDGKYGVVNKIGKMVIPCEYDKIYSITNEDKDEIYLEKDKKTTKLSKYLEENKIDVIGDSNTVDINLYTNETTDNNTVENGIIDNSLLENTITQDTTTNTQTQNTLTNQNTQNNTEDENKFVIVL